MNALQVPFLQQEGDDSSAAGQRQGTGTEALVEHLQDVLRQDVPEGLVKLQYESVDAWCLPSLHHL